MPDRPPRQPSRKKGRTDERPRRIADESAPEPVPEHPMVQSPVTETGLPVEDQIEKEWDPNKDGGLPTLLRAGRR